jgi:3-hydroxybutyryl-CoA dehydrogenase
MWMADTPQADGATGQPVVVVGGGLMGHGIAEIFAAAGHRVTVCDRDAAARASVLERIADAAALRGDDPSSVLERVRVTGTLSGAAEDACLVVEAVAENLAVKRAVFGELSRLTGSTAILATNTSALPVREVASAARHPERVIGTHFWNPPHLVPLVEVVQSELTSDNTVRRTMEILATAGKSPVHVRRDMPGFIGNRLQHALKREAIALVAQGVCDAETIDRVVKEGFGPRMSVLGPMEQSDLVGLDLTLAIHETLMPSLSRNAAPDALLVRLVRQGKTGMSAGEGFRKWTPEGAREVQSRLSEFLARRAADS